MVLISGGHALGGALGAFFGGYLFDLFARYTEMWWFAFGTAILAGLMVFMLRENRAERGVLAVGALAPVLHLWLYPFYIASAMNLTFETEQEDDGRWLAEVPEIVGVMAYGATKLEAMAKAEVLALRALAEQLEHGEARPMNVRISIAAE